MGEVIQFNSERQMDDEPTLGDGYCRVVNALAEGLASNPLTATQQRVVWGVIRATYGWQKPKGKVPGGLLAKITGMTRQRCSTVVAELIDAGVLIRQGGSRGELKINTKTEQWNFRKKSADGSQNLRVNKNSTFCSLNSNSVHLENSNSVQLKDKRQSNNPSDYSSKKSGKKKSSSKIVERAALQNPSGTKFGYEIDVELAELIARVVDNRLGRDAPANRNMTTWANDIRLIREQDKRTPEMIKALFAFAMGDSFWSGNIESPAALRRNWTKLAMKRKAQRDEVAGHGKHQSGSRPNHELDKQLTDPGHAIDNWD